MTQSGTMSHARSLVLQPLALSIPWLPPSVIPHALKVVFAVLADFTTRRQPHPAALLCRQESKVGNKRGRYEFPFSSTTYEHTHNIYSFGLASTMEF